MVCFFYWTGVTSLEIAFGPWRRSRFFCEKVRIVSTLSKFTVRPGCEDGTEKLRVVHEPNVPAAGLWSLLALMPEDFHRTPDVPYLMSLECFNTDSWSILGIREGRVEKGTKTRRRTALRCRASCGLRQGRSGTSFESNFGSQVVTRHNTPQRSILEH